MKKEAEDIIKAKSYAELTAGEHEIIADLASSKEEYDQLKWFLTTTANTVESGKIKADPSLRKGVMNHLHNPSQRKGAWLNSVVLTLVPKNKPFHRQPLVQLGAVAAALLLVLNVVDFSEDKPSNIALNDPLKQEKITQPYPDQLSNPELPQSESPIRENVKNELIESEYRGDQLNKGLSDGDNNYALESQTEEESILDLVEPVTFADLDAPEIPVMEDEVVVMETEEKRIEASAPKVEQLNTKDLNLSQVERDEVEEVETHHQLFTSKKENLGRFKESAAADQEQSDRVVGRILPKSLHINATKELNQFFYVP